MESESTLVRDDPRNCSVQYDEIPRQSPPTGQIVHQKVDAAVDGEKKVRYREEARDQLQVRYKFVNVSATSIISTSGGDPIISRTLGTIFKQ